jgi:hypothetical protein
MVKSGFVCFVFMVFVLGTLAAQDQRGAEKNLQVVLKYLGTAGWEISDGTTSILIDPYLSRIKGPTPLGGVSGHSLAGDTRRAYGWGELYLRSRPAQNGREFVVTDFAPLESSLRFRPSWRWTRLYVRRSLPLLVRFSAVDHCRRGSQ